MAASVDEELVRKIASFIREHNGQDTVIIDISELNSWTDYFIVSTVTSSGHLRGLLNQLYDFILKSGLDMRCRHKKTEDEKWILLDCGNVIIHLMNEEARSFYNLEKLWFNGKPVDF